MYSSGRSKATARTMGRPIIGLGKGEDVLQAGGNENVQADEKPASDGQRGDNQIIEIDVVETFDVGIAGPELVDCMYA
jgi:hypothetical protein